MNIKRNNKTKIIILSVISAFLIGLGVYVYATKPQNNPPTINSTPDNSEQSPPVNNDTSPSQNDETPITPSPQNETEQTSNPLKADVDQSSIEKLSVAITSASVEGSTLYVRTEIKGLHSDGSCTLLLTKGSEQVKKKSGLQPLSQLTTCKGFDIPVSELNKGTWDLSVTVSSGGKFGTKTDSIAI